MQKTFGPKKGVLNPSSASLRNLLLRSFDTCCCRKEWTGAKSIKKTSPLLLLPLLLLPTLFCSLLFVGAYWVGGYMKNIGPCVCMGVKSVLSPRYFEPCRLSDLFFKADRTASFKSKEFERSWGKFDLIIMPCPIRFSWLLLPFSMSRFAVSCHAINKQRKLFPKW